MITYQYDANGKLTGYAKSDGLWKQILKAEFMASLFELLIPISLFVLMVIGSLSIYYLSLLFRFLHIW